MLSACYDRPASILSFEALFLTAIFQDFKVKTYLTLPLIQSWNESSTIIFEKDEHDEMYHLVKSLYMYATSKEEYSIVLLGLDNAGKTTLLSQIKSLFSIDEVSTTAGNTVPTVGQNVATIDLPDMYLKIWDVGGQLSLRKLWQSYYKSAHAIIFVVDSSDVGTDPDISKVPGYLERRKSTVGPLEDNQPPMTPLTPGFTNFDERGWARLDECRQVLESILQHEDASGIPILVLANKQDREDCVEVVRIKEGFVRKVFEGEKGHHVRDSRVLPVSALQGVGVKEAVDWVRSRILWNKESRPPVMR